MVKWKFAQQTEYKVSVSDGQNTLSHSIVSILEAAQ